MAPGQPDSLECLGVDALTRLPWRLRTVAGQPSTNWSRRPTSKSGGSAPNWWTISVPMTWPRTHLSGPYVRFPISAVRPRPERGCWPLPAMPAWTSYGRGPANAVGTLRWQLAFWSTGVTDDIGQEIGVSDVLARLAPERREAFVLTQLLGLSYQEAAEICACPPGTIRSRVARARAELLEALARERQDRTVSDGSYAIVTSMYPITRHMTS